MCSVRAQTDAREAYYNILHILYIPVNNTTSRANTRRGGS